MILQALIDQILQRFQHEKRAQVCLWFDEKQEFRRLIPEFKQYLQENEETLFCLLDYSSEEGRGQIGIKHRIFKERSGLSPEERGKKSDLSYMCPSRKSGWKALMKKETITLNSSWSTRWPASCGG